MLNRLMLIVAVLGVWNAAFGDDFFISGAGARSAATGGAWLPSSTSALDAMAINPAGLSLLSGRTLEVSVLGGFARGKFVNSANSDGRLGSAGAIPYGAFGTPLGASRFSLGFAALPQLLSAANWRYTDAPGRPGGVGYGQLNNKSDITVVRAAAGMGIYLGPRFQIGATLGVAYNANTLETAYVFQSNPALAGLKTLLSLHTKGVGLNGSVGTLARLSRSLQLGVTYKSPTTIQSSGAATGNAAVQFAQIGLGAARPDFRYQAEVDNRFPQSVTANVVWAADSRLRVVAQADWINWKSAFRSLPVVLTRGNNMDINGLLGTDGIRDSIPLAWRDQIVGRVGIERAWREDMVLRAGYARANSPVPSSTLSPLTAAITRNTLSTGFGYRPGRYNFDAAWIIDPSVEQSVGQSGLQAGEYSNSRVRVGVQSVVLTASIHL